MLSGARYGAVIINCDQVAIQSICFSFGFCPGRSIDNGVKTVATFEIIGLDSYVGCRAGYLWGYVVRPSADIVSKKFSSFSTFRSAVVETFMVLDVSPREIVVLTAA